MISITCTQCRALLTIDDAFAGGVCRCQHCGTIQTVPSQLKPTATPQPYVNPSSAKSKSLYQKKAAVGMSGPNVATSGANEPSGLDDLAQAVASSSGLSGSGLRSSHLSATQTAPKKPAPAAQITAPAAPAEQRTIPLIPVMIAAGAIVLVLVGVIIFLIVHGGSNTPGGGGGNSGSGGHGGVGAAPSFCGMPLAGSNVVYLLDRANSISNEFDPAKAAVFQSVSTLGADRKFAVILWNNGGADIAFPSDGTRNATSDQIDQLKHLLEDVTATGSSRLRGSLERAMTRSPDVVVIVTAKTKLDEDDENALTAIQDSAGGKFKIDVVTVGNAGDNAFLKLAAKTTGGEYRHLSASELRAASP